MSKVVLSIFVPVVDHEPINKQGEEQNGFSRQIAFSGLSEPEQCCLCFSEFKQGLVLSRGIQYS